jgi:uncharacterized protein YjbJ (UPF0337 family)
LLSHADVSSKEIGMNWDRVQGYWQQVTGKAREQWGKLIDNDLDIVAGRRDQLSARSGSATE